MNVKLLSRLAVVALLVAILSISIALLPGQVEAQRYNGPITQAVNTGPIVGDTTFTRQFWVTNQRINTRADFFVAVQQSALITQSNPITVQVQVSPDGIYWFDYLTLTAAGALTQTTSSNVYSSTATTGIAYRIKATTVNTYPVTPIIKVQLWE